MILGVDTNLNYSQFPHRRFHAKDGESDVKRYIEELPTEEDSIWYQRGKTSKKLYKELVPLVYYIKYKYGPKPSITFQVNEVKEITLTDGCMRITQSSNRFRLQLQTIRRKKPMRTGV